MRYKWSSVSQPVDQVLSVQICDRCSMISHRWSVIRALCVVGQWPIGNVKAQFANSLPIGMRIACCVITAPSVCLSTFQLANGSLAGWFGAAYVHKRLPTFSFGPCGCCCEAGQHSAMATFCDNLAATPPTERERQRTRARASDNRRSISECRHRWHRQSILSAVRGAVRRTKNRKTNSYVKSLFKYKNVFIICQTRQRATDGGQRTADSDSNSDKQVHSMFINNARPRHAL